MENQHVKSNTDHINFKYKVLFSTVYVIMILVVLLIPCQSIRDSEDKAMRMDKKLILLFSLLTMIITLGNSVYAYKYNMDLLHENTYSTLIALGKKMLSEVESYIQLMDYAIEELTTNVEFMNAMRRASMEGDQWHEEDQIKMQKLMYQCLYQEPLMENFYRVSVFSHNGFYMSSHPDKTGVVSSMSDEARALIASLPYLEDANSTPSTPHIVVPHLDPWSYASNAPVVFSSIRSIQWHGKHIGYIEVAALLDELIRIFTVEELEGLSAHVLFEDGREFFRFYGDNATYENATDSDMMLFTLPDGSKRFAVRVHSYALGLDVYIAQDIASYEKQSRQLLLQHLGVGSSFLAAGILYIIIISTSLTRSIRSLTKKIKHLSSRRVMDTTSELALKSVTNPRDKEIFTLEQMLNDLLLRLRKSAQREISLQNATLQAQLNALQTQINPHFVYNTLNIISAKGMESGNEEIMEICNQFAEMLRYSTDVRSRSATLASEVLNAEHYLHLAKARYEDQLEFHIDMPENSDDLLVPKLTLQPLIENALTHSMKGHAGRLVINLTGTLHDNTLRLIIRDNGCGFEQDVLDRLNAAFAEIDQNPTPYADPPNGHIGLINTYLRLHYYSRGKIRMLLYNDGGAVVELNLPCERSEHHV